MYATLMKKIMLPNEIVLYNPITIIEGEYDKEYNLFLDKFNNEFYLADDISFATSEACDCVYYVMTDEELILKYGTKDVKTALSCYQDDVFNNFIFASNVGKEKMNIYKIDIYELIDIATNPTISSSDYNGMVSIPKRKLYALTQISDVEKLQQFIDKAVRDLNELDRLNREKKPEILVKNDKSMTNSDVRRYIDIEELEAYLKERIIGQDENIENLVTVIGENYKTTDAHSIERPLIMGPSGVGKTETLKLLAEYLDVPFIRFSTPTLSGSGYVGNDIEDILRMAYLNSSKNIEKCEESLIFLDEFDKVASRGLRVSDVAVQNLLLNFLDGTTYNVNLPNYEKVNIDTTFMNIVVGGAFVDVIKDKNKRIGFASNNEEDLTVSDEDIINFGFIPEIVGRLSPKIMYNNLTKEDLKNILLNGKFSPLLLKQQFYKKIYDVDLKYDPSYVDGIIEIVESNNTGARRLKQIVFASLLDVGHALQKFSNKDKIKEVIIDRKILSNNKVYTLKKK